MTAAIIAIGNSASYLPGRRRKLALAKVGIVDMKARGARAIEFLERRASQTLLLAA